MTIPLDASGLNFCVGPGLGRATRVFYSVKQLKTTFRAGLGPQKIFRELQDLCPRPSSKVRGRAWHGPGRASEPGRAQNAQVYPTLTVRRSMTCGPIER
jgi:hypothetical protein